VPDDMDDRSRIVAESLDARNAAARRTERLVAEQLAVPARQQAAEAVTPLVVALRERTRGVLLGELERSLRGKLRHLPPEAQQALRTMLEAASNKLMHEPSTRLKERAELPEAPAEVELVRRLFGLEALGAKAA
jgi:glutamyl-tRNA reductase